MDAVSYVLFLMYAFLSGMFVCGIAMKIDRYFGFKVPISIIVFGFGMAWLNGFVFYPYLERFLNDLHGVS